MVQTMRRPVFLDGIDRPKSDTQLQIRSFRSPRPGEEAMRSLVQDHAEGIHPQSQEEDEQDPQWNGPGQRQASEEIGGRQQDRHLDPQDADGSERVRQRRRRERTEPFGADQLGEILPPEPLTAGRRLFATLHRRHPRPSRSECTVPTDPYQLRKGPAYGAATGLSSAARTETADSGQNGVIVCPICGSDRTWLYRTDVMDLEYFVEPPRAFAVQESGGCGSEFLTPRPLESELPPFSTKRWEKEFKPQPYTTAKARGWNTRPITSVPSRGTTITPVLSPSPRSPCGLHC